MPPGARDRLAVPRRSPRPPRAVALACRRGRSGRPRTAPRRRRRARRCAARPRSGPAAGSAACRTVRRRSGWRAPARRAPPPNSLRRACETNDQVTASIRPQPPSARLASRVRFLQQRQHRPPARRSGPRAAEAARPGSSPAMRTTSSTRSALPSHVRPPGRHADEDPVAVAGRPRARSRGVPGCAPSRRRQVEPGEAVHLAPGEVDPMSGSGTAPATAISVGVPPQRSITSAVARSRPGHAEGRIDAALEPIARVGVDAELAARLGDVERVPQGAFDQHVRGASRRSPSASPPMMPAIDSARDRRRSPRSSRIERIGPAVERHDALAVRAPAARRDRPSTFAASNTCSGRPRSKVR